MTDLTALNINHLIDSLSLIRSKLLADWTPNYCLGRVFNVVERLGYPGFGVTCTGSMILVSNIFVDVCTFTRN
jgi:hypothetical protein